MVKQATSTADVPIIAAGNGGARAVVAPPWVHCPRDASDKTFSVHRDGTPLGGEQEALANRWQLAFCCNTMDAWDLQQHVPLAPLTTLEVGGPARFLVTVHRLQWLPSILAWARKENHPTRLLGGGSNLVVSDQGWPGLVVHLPAHGALQMDLHRATAPASLQLDPHRAAAPALPQLDPHRAATPASVQVDAPAHMPWDCLVAATTQAGLCGLACLSGIPGLVGAAPVQNIGAYGQSLSDSLVSVDVVDVAQGSSMRLAAGACGLGYRSSHFKGPWRQRYIITGLTVRLRAGPPVAVAHAELRRQLGLAPGQSTEHLSGQNLRDAVLQLRRGKSMLWDVDDPNHRSAGSFFVNPQVDHHSAQKLLQRYPDMPVWPTDAHSSKLSAAWLIETAGFNKGWVHGRAGLSSRHSLALINRGGATTHELVQAAARIRTEVAARFAVVLVPEPTFWGFDTPVPAALAVPLGAACPASTTT